MTLPGMGESMTEIGVGGKAVDWCLVGSQIATMIDGQQMGAHVSASAATSLRRIRMSTSRRALVIDDQRSNIEVLAMLLAQQGVATVAVESLRQVAAGLDELGRVCKLEQGKKTTLQCVKRV